MERTRENWNYILCKTSQGMHNTGCIGNSNFPQFLTPSGFIVSGLPIVGSNLRDGQSETSNSSRQWLLPIGKDTKASYPLIVNFSTWGGNSFNNTVLQYCNFNSFMAGKCGSEVTSSWHFSITSVFKEKKVVRKTLGQVTTILYIKLLETRESYYTFIFISERKPSLQ